MLEDKQIIIDGVDVSECGFYHSETGTECHIALAFAEEYTDDNHTYFKCEQNPNCYYKQLKRKEQECDMWKNLTVDNGAVALKYQQQLDQLKAELEAYKMEADEGKEINAELKAENAELKRIRDKNFVHALEEQAKANKLSKALTEIKEIIQNQGHIDILEEQILQKISEVEDEKV